MRKAEKKYIKLCTNVILGVIAGSLITAAVLQHEERVLPDSVGQVGEEQVEVTFEGLRSTLSDVSECYLCGNSNESLMDYYRKFDTIGLISLNDWYVIDYRLRSYNEEGKEVASDTGTNMAHGTTDEIIYSLDATPSRGMSEIEVELPEDHKIEETFLRKYLCQNCLDKIADSLSYWKGETEKKEAIPLCIVDFKTLDIYPVQDSYVSYFIRDYYVELHFEDNKVVTQAFYLPERV
ncbi:hypothetical protein [Blautia sp. MSJ-36]|uniref:hypothetical protein n=1 Tax=Blautia sp. MSJ-36 TaxID=2841530 RepID=UPI001C0F421E|nr:hypothetical protein [Blautia sp. MSJ-36]MBU5446308.1 hypothetical protein [Blautia sp. MSJ-36]